MKINVLPDDIYRAMTDLPVLNVPFVKNATEADFLSHLIAYREYQAAIDLKIEALLTEATRVDWQVSQALQHRALTAK